MIDNYIGKQMRYKNRLIGTVTKDGNFIMFKKPIHVFRLYNSFGINSDVLDDLIFKDVKRMIVFLQHQSGEIVYIVTPQNWKKNGISYFNKKDNEEQIHLPLTKFDETKGLI